jgi:hypothetical protein
MARWVGHGQNCELDVPGALFSADVGMIATLRFSPGLAG